MHTPSQSPSCGSARLTLAMSANCEAILPRNLPMGDTVSKLSEIKLLCWLEALCNRPFVACLVCSSRVHCELEKRTRAETNVMLRCVGSVADAMFPAHFALQTIGKEFLGKFVVQETSTWLSCPTNTPTPRELMRRDDDFLCCLVVGWPQCGYSEPQSPLCHSVKSAAALKRGSWLQHSSNFVEDASEIEEHAHTVRFFALPTHTK